MDYKNVLQRSLVPFLREHQQKEWIFQQDNAFFRVSKRRLDLFRCKKIANLDWPAYSPDLNHIEELRGILTRRVFTLNKQFHSLNELKACILREWESLDQELLKKLVGSTPDRTFQDINNHRAIMK